MNKFMEFTQACPVAGFTFFFGSMILAATTGVVLSQVAPSVLLTLLGVAFGFLIVKIAKEVMAWRKSK